jgi:hypothetical protein
MAKTFTAPFAQTPQTASAVATGVVSLTSSGVEQSATITNSVLLLTAGADGSILTSLSAIPRATVTATALWIWSSTDGGTTKNLIASALMAAYTLAATTENTRTVFKHADGTVINETAPLRLAAGEKLYVGIGVALASGIMFNARYSDF